MASKAEQLPSHYEVLGVAPTASSDDIARAFANAMSMFGVRPVAVAAHISEAFEVLRNPEKRRLYDRSIGVGPKEQPFQWRLSITPQPSKQFHTEAMTRSTRVSARPAAQPEPPMRVGPDPSLLSDAQAADAKISALIKSLHALAEPSVPPRPTVDIPPREVQRPRPQTVEDHTQPAAKNGLPYRQSEVVWLNGAEQGTDWRRPLLKVGGLVLGAGVIGTIAGLSIPTDQQGPITAPIHRMNARSSVKPPVQVAASGADEAQVQDRQALGPPPRAFQIRRANPHRRLAYHAEAPSAETQFADGASDKIDTNAVDPLASEATATQPVSVKSPLPKSVIARTINRIGYACGSVSSVAPVEGTRGAFQIRCTSGHSYRAALVGGRYHFRRLGRQ